MVQTIVVLEKSSWDGLNPTQKQNHEYSDIFSKFPAATISRTYLKYKAHVGGIAIQSQGCHAHECCDGTSHPIRKLPMFTLGHIVASSESEYVLELALNARPVLRTVRIGAGGPSLINQMDAP